MGREGGVWRRVSGRRQATQGEWKKDGGGKEAAFRRGRVWEWAKADLMATTRGRGKEDGLGGGGEGKTKRRELFFREKKKKERNKVSHKDLVD